ncbi:MAG: amino acid ABC transporter substrate-binding protein [Clostridiales bacterium]|jgi:polar amino acid transport system substrate-binding protein|nr:amino acid ABC transporter substrate-binding protein [Clostridiales bacterium]
MKKLWVLLCAALLAFSFAGCAGGGSEKIIVGLDDKFPPMGFRDENGELVGFDIDMARAAGEKMGVEMEFQPINWSAKELELSAKKVDLLWNGYTITEERKQQVLFTKPYLENKQVIVVAADAGITTKADLAGKIVTLQKDSSAMDALSADEATKNSLAEVVELEDNIMAFQDLAIGRTNAVVIDEVVAKYYLEQNETNFILLEDNFGDEQYGVGVRLDDKELLDKLQKALDEMNEDGTAKRISEQWFGDDIVIK